MLSALDSLPNKRLIKGELEEDGEVCAIGSVGLRRGIDMSNIDPHDRESLSAAFGIPSALAAEIMYENDDANHWKKETAEQRWQRIRNWVENNIKE